MNRLRQRVARLVVVAVAVAVVPATNAAPVSASPADEKARVEQIVDELARLEERSDILAEDYVTAIDEKNQLDAAIAKAEKRVTTRESQVAELRGSLADMAVQAYMDSGTNGLGPLFTDTTEITDGLTRDELSRVALSTGTATTDELDQLVSDLEEDRDELAQLREDAAAKAEQIEAAKVATDETKAEYQAAREDAEAEYQQALVEEEERRATESFERMQREAEEARRRAEEQQPETPTPDAPAPAPTPTDDDDQTPAPAPTPDDDDDTPVVDPGPVDPPSDPPPVSGRSDTAIAAARSQLGVPYVYAKAIPGVAFDCSGLTSWSWAQAGVYLPHQSRAQYATVPHVAESQAQPGDLIFYYSPISHVSIYLGGGQAIHAPNSGSVVSYTTVNWGNVTGVGRPG